MDLIDKRLGQYHIVAQIGRDEMAVVYRARQPVLGRDVVIKVLHPALLIQGQDAVRRFQREAKAAAALSHPHIVPIYDIGYDVPESPDGKKHGRQAYHYLVMKAMPGQTLKDVLQRQGRLPLAQATEIIAQVAGALDYAHERRLVHRDVKPGNIMVDNSGRAALTDFGLARALQQPRVTRPGEVKGTPEYMSPEQATGRPVGPQTDVYSLGIVCYEMLAGQVPFRGDTAQVLRAQKQDRPPPLQRWNEQIPEGVDRVVQRALLKDPKKRYRRASVFVADLKAASTRSKTVLVRRRWLMRGLVAAAAILVLFLGWLFLAGGGERSPLPTATQTVTPTREVTRTPTPTPLLTRTRTPTPAAQPTATLRPTNTPRPTSTSTTTASPTKRTSPTPTLGATGATTTTSPPPVEPSPGGPTEPPQPTQGQPTKPPEPTQPLVTFEPPPTPRPPTPTPDNRPATPEP